MIKAVHTAPSSLTQGLRERLMPLSNKERVSVSFQTMVQCIEAMCKEHTERTGQEFLPMSGTVLMSKTKKQEVAAYKWLFHQRRKSRAGKLKISDLEKIFSLKIKMNSSGRCLSINDWFVEPQKPQREPVDMRSLGCSDQISKIYVSPFTRRKFVLGFPMSTEEVQEAFSVSEKRLKSLMGCGLSKNVDFVEVGRKGATYWSKWVAVSIALEAVKNWPQACQADVLTLFKAIEFCKLNDIGNEVVSGFAKQGHDALRVYSTVSAIVHGTGTAPRYK